MINVIKNRHNTIGLIILFYLATVVILSAIAVKIAPVDKSFKILAYGLFLGASGSLATLFLLRSWEKHLTENHNPSSPSFPLPEEEEEDLKLKEEKENERISLLETIIEEKEKTVSEYQAKLQEFEQECLEKKEELKQIKQEWEKDKEELRSTKHHYTAYKEETENTIGQKVILSEEYQQTITDQRTVIKKKQRQIVQLEEKVRDLNYEIKTLLELNDSFKKPEQKMQDPPPPPPPAQPARPTSPHSAESASVQLKRCLNIAQKITGAHHFGNSSRFRDINMQNFHLDKRRLFDSLRSENAFAVVVFSPSENKLLFANNEVKTILGWSPEKFSLNFSEIIQDGATEWNRGVSRLSTEPETLVRLLARTRQGEEILIHSLLGMIPTGLFRGHVIGILYRA